MERSLIEQIKEGIYFGTISKLDILEAIVQAEEDLEKDKVKQCKHEYIYQADDYGYYKCRKCGIMK